MPPPPTHIRDALLTALRIRHSIAGLETFAHQLALLAVNAKVASARIGDHGRPFRVITQEITNASTALDATVAHIRDLTHRWTQVIARALSLAREGDILGDAAARCPGDSPANTSLTRAHAELRARLDDCMNRHPALLAELLDIAQQMGRELQIIDYIKITLLVESAHLPRAALGSAGENPFAHLAEEMHSATLRIRAIASLATGAEALAA
ncbi:MAG: hypothetical protein AB7O21_08665 [Gammaproteobacteria bacterium]